MKFQATTSVLVLSTIPSALAWGSLGHQTIAYIAQNFVSAETETFFKKILGDDTSSYLANAATWVRNPNSHRASAKCRVVTYIFFRLIATVIQPLEPLRTISTL